MTMQRKIEKINEMKVETKLSNAFYNFYLHNFHLHNNQFYKNNSSLKLKTNSPFFVNCAAIIIKSVVNFTNKKCYI